MKLLRKTKCCYVLFCFLYLRYLPALQLGRQTKTILQIAQHPQKKRYQLYEGQLLQPFQRKRLLFRQYRLLFSHPKMAYLIQR